jgi:glucokinase
MDPPILLEPPRDKGRFRGFMEKIPAHVILHDKPALLGAAVCAFEPIYY